MSTIGSVNEQTEVERRDALVERLFEAVLGFNDIYLIYIGDRLGLYLALAEGGPATSVQLAEATGTHERYERLDDGSIPEHARLKKVWQLFWSPEDGASTVLPHDGGIHRVGNPGTGMAVSVHLYGPRLGEVDGRDYDPSRDYVCDRVDV